MRAYVAAPSVCIFLTFDPLSLIGFRSLLVLIFAFQAVMQLRDGRSFNRTICS